MSCAPKRHDELDTARRQLLDFDGVWGVSIQPPARDPLDTWALEVSLGPNADGFRLSHHRVADRYGLRPVEIAPRSPDETRVVLAD